MNLLTLPKELLLEILTLALPYDFESLALSCKQIHDAATLLLPRHNHRRKRYRSLEFGKETWKTVLELLVEIANEPIIASYIIHANLGNRTEQEEDELPYKYPDGVPPALSRLIQGSEHLSALNPEPEFASQWLQRIVEYTMGYDENSVDYQVAFLLTLLTDVQSLALPGDWHGTSAVGVLNHREELNELELSVSALCQLLVARANDPSLTNQPLQKLHTLRPTCNIDTQFGADMESIFPFLALNSLREVDHASAVYGPHSDEFYQGFCTKYPTMGCNIEVLNLQDYVVSGMGARILFKDMKNLRSLDYEYVVKDGVGDYFEAVDFYRHVLRNLGGHLESLTLQSQTRSAFQNCIKSHFRAFKVLQHLDISTDYFLGEYDDQDEDYDDDEDSEDDTSDEDEGEDQDSYEGEDDEERGEDESMDCHTDQEEDKNENQETGQDDIDGHSDQDSQIDGSENDGNNDKGSETSSNGVVHDMTEYYKYVSFHEYRALRMVKHFPSSLKTVRLSARATERDCKFLEKFFKYFNERREEMLPLLETLEVYMSNRDDWGWLMDDPEPHIEQAAEFFSGIPFVTFVKP